MSTLVLKGDSTGSITITTDGITNNVLLTVPNNTDTVVTLAETQTLTNKTIDANDNTITNLGITELGGITGSASSTTYLRGDGTWDTPSGGAGSGTINSGTTNQLAYYASSGTTVSGLTSGNNSLLVTDGTGAPSISTTLPNGLAMGTPTSLTLTNATGLPLSGLVSVSNNTVLGNISGSSAAPSALTATQLTTLINTFTSSLSGAVPSSGGGTTNYLRADGTWTAPSGSGTVSSVGLSSSGSTLSVSGTPITSSGTINADLNLAHANTWTAAQSFTTSGILLKGSSTGYTTFTSANSSATNYTLTTPATTDTVAVLGTAQTFTTTQTFSGTLNVSGTFQKSGNTMTFPGSAATLAGIGVAQTWTAAQSFTASGILLKGSSTGYTTFTSANASATAYTITVPAITDTLVTLTSTQTLTNKTLTSPVISTITNTGTLTLPTSSDTLVGRATTDTLTNKTLTSPTLTTPTADRYLTSTSNINAQTGTTYTLTSTDNGKTVLLNNASAIALSVNTGLTAGFWCNIIQTGAGQVTLSGTATLNSSNGLKTRAQYSMLTVTYMNVTDTYVVAGDTST